MKITNFEVEQKAFSSYSRIEKSESSIHVFKVNPPEQQAGAASQNPVALSLSGAEISTEETEFDKLFHLSEEDLAKIRLLEKLLSALTGKTFKFQQVVKLDDESRAKATRSSAPNVSVANPGRPNAGNIGIRITARHELQESEQMSFSSRGVVKTADGRTIDFKVNLNMARSYYESSEVLIEIGAKMQDPLVINFDGRGIAFGEDMIELDINLDGTIDQFKNLAAGSGFLVFDKNGNGVVDDGSELFGPETGRGFDELAAYDTDKNGWIDESDVIFKSLSIWTVSPSGEKTLIGLKEADVGAIYLGNISSQFHVKQGADTVARIRESSVYLKESSGLAGVIHEIDLKI
jgi:hypothetical protein